MFNFKDTAAVANAADMFGKHAKSEKGMKSSRERISRERLLITCTLTVEMFALDTRAEGRLLDAAQASEFKTAMVEAGLGDMSQNGQLTGTAKRLFENANKLRAEIVQGNIPGVRADANSNIDAGALVYAIKEFTDKSTGNTSAIDSQTALETFFRRHDEKPDELRIMAQKIAKMDDPKDALKALREMVAEEVREAKAQAKAKADTKADAEKVKQVKALAKAA